MGTNVQIIQVNSPVVFQKAEYGFFLTLWTLLCRLACLAPFHLQMLDCKIVIIVSKLMKIKYEHFVLN